MYEELANIEKNNKKLIKCKIIKEFKNLKFKKI
jgi:hypothetical protein